ncbi:MAG: acylase, partial [Gemmatimonadota bacterium]
MDSATHRRTPVRVATDAARAAIIAACAVLLAACNAALDDERDRSPAAPETSEILWDRWGVPHVYGATVDELGYGFGWAQMRHHGDAILELYGVARGRAAEYWGADHIASDRLVRILGIPEKGRETFEAQDQELRRYIEGFVAGMNAYADAHPERISDRARAVLPVEEADPLRHGLRGLFAFLAVTGDREPPVGLDGFPTGPVPGSNAWAIGPSRSASGNAMLLQNPHLPWRIPLMRFTEAHLVGPGVDLYGVTQIGVPVIAIGFNERLGWSHTVNRIDAFDTWRLSLAGDGYRFDGAVRPFEVERQVMRIRDDDGELRADTLVVRRSVHGPVVEMDDSTAVAVRTPLLQRHDWVEPWWRMGRARDLDEFEAVSARLGVPMFTTVYADRDGHIYNLFGGQVPVRPSGDFADWQMSAPGDTSATLWTEVHPYEDLPKVVDPPSGFVQNSNSPPWYATVPSPLDPADFPPYMAPPPWVNLREARAIEMLLSDESITFDELIELRYSTRMLLADRLVDDLVDAARSYGGATGRAAADVLEAWDRNADADSRGAVLFAFWAQE